MLDLAVFQAFGKEAGAARAVARGAESVGKKVLRAGAETGGILRDSLDPRRMGKGLREGGLAMSNVSPDKKKALQSAIQKRGPGYTADFHTSNTVGARLRRAGILGNVPLYSGPSRTKKVLNSAARALPGEAGTAVPLAAADAYGTLQERQDPETGRRKGVAERGLRAGMGLTTGIIGMRAGFVPGMVSAGVGDFVGGRVGRAVDRAAGAALGAVPLASGVR